MSPAPGPQLPAGSPQEAPRGAGRCGRRGRRGCWVKLVSLGHGLGASIPAGPLRRRQKRLGKESARRRAPSPITGSPRGPATPNGNTKRQHQRQHQTANQTGGIRCSNTATSQLERRWPRSAPAARTGLRPRPATAATAHPGERGRAQGCQRQKGSHSLTNKSYKVLVKRKGKAGLSADG